MRTGATDDGMICASCRTSQGPFYSPGGSAFYCVPCFNRMLPPDRTDMEGWDFLKRNPGMTTGDFFAAAALIGLLAQADAPAVDRRNAAEFAEMAFDYGVAMLAEKERREKS